MGQLFEADRLEQPGDVGHVQTTANVARVDGGWQVDGAAINPSRRYRTTVNSFLAEGGEATLDFLDVNAAASGSDCSTGTATSGVRSSRSFHDLEPGDNRQSRRGSATERSRVCQYHASATSL